jgi:hypothetical protein
MYRLAFNPTDRPVIVDDEGRVLAGHDWEALDDTDERILALVEQGQLVWPATPDALPGDGTPAGAAAQKALDLNQQAEQPAPTTKRKANS